MTYSLIQGLSSDLPIINTGNYYFKNDTIIIVPDHLIDDIQVTRKTNQTNSFYMSFSDFQNLPILLDSVKIYEKSSSISTIYNASDLKFSDADSIKAYLTGKAIKISTHLNDYKQNKFIKINLPVDYFVMINEKKIIQTKGKIKFKK